MQRHAIDPPDLFDSRQYGFSQAVAVRGGTLVLASGQVGIDADEQPVGDDLAAQVDGALDNLERLLTAAGGGLDDVVRVRIYVVAAVADDLSPVGEALRTRFRDPPASTWLVVPALARPEFLVEIEADAVVDG